MALISLCRNDDCVPYPDVSTFDNCRDKTTSIRERMFKTTLLTTKVIRPFAGCAVLNTSKLRRTNPERPTNQRHQFDAFCNSISSTVSGFEPTFREKLAADQRHLTQTHISFIEASLACRVTITLKASTRTSETCCIAFPAIGQIQIAATVPLIRFPSILTKMAR